ncbi:hypothetical protein M433DRAFT_298781 [Acidomyces richmondensis BFW]|nr:MAG: hypothetical protein FE78DRAFT_475629 [Acidomyces sp. 'richmondensis']KYG49509.1 hypothetical protein M433DRAFT_298781 [Acidomyces richmondensis BFW]
MCHISRGCHISSSSAIGSGKGCNSSFRSLSALRVSGTFSCESLRSKCSPEWLILFPSVILPGSVSKRALNFLLDCRPGSVIFSLLGGIYDI